MSEAEFTGYPKDLLVFLNELRRNNSKAWFEKNRKRYEAVYRAPAKAFCAAMVPQLSKLAGVEHDAKIYRINRDLRFSKDKTPYNTHLHLSFIPVDAPAPAWSFGFSPDYLTIGTGIMGLEKRALEAFRVRVDGKDGAALQRLIARLEKQGARVGEPELKRIPSQFPADHPRADLLRRKSLTVWLDIDSLAAASRATLVRDCIARYRKLRPVFDWLREL